MKELGKMCATDIREGLKKQDEVVNSLSYKIVNFLERGLTDQKKSVKFGKEFIADIRVSDVGQ